MKGADSDRGLFRGSELPKLVLLAGVLVVGWVVVFSVGLPAKSKPKPANPAITNQPKLPQADASLQSILDGTGLGVRDEEPMAMLFNRMRSDPAKLATEARREVVPFDLWKSPKRYRGLPIRFEGYVTQVYAHDDWDPEITPAGRLYEVWFVQEEHEERMYPCILFVDEVPNTLPGGRNLRERVSFEGYFLKLYRYKRADNKDYLAPMLVGRIAHVPDASDGADAQRVPFSDWLWTYRWRIVPLAALIYVSLRVAFRFLGRPGRVPRRTFSRPTDTIDPAELDQWVEGAQDDDGLEWDRPRKPGIVAPDDEP